MLVEDGRLKRVDGVTGKILWSVPYTGGDTRSALAIGDLIVASGSLLVCGYRVSDGLELWKAQLSSQKNQDTIQVWLSGDAVFAQTEEALYCLSPKDGTVRWRRETGKVKSVQIESWIATVGEPKGRNQGRLAVYQATDGSLLWEYSKPLDSTRIVALPNRRIAVRRAPDTICCLSLQDGKELWSRPGFHGWGPPLEEAVVLWGATGSLSCVLVDGTAGQNTTPTLPKDTVQVLHATSERLYVHLTDGDSQPEIGCIRRSDGAILWTRRVPRLRDKWGAPTTWFPGPRGLVQHREFLLVTVDTQTTMSGMHPDVAYRLDAYSLEGELRWAINLPGQPLQIAPPFILCSNGTFEKGPSAVSLIKIAKLE